MAGRSYETFESMRKIPRQRRARDTIGMIFQATAQILERDGEQALNTNRVAERAGFSVGTLYQYFPSMDAILQAMVDYERLRVMRHLNLLLETALAEDEHPARTIRNFIRALIHNYGRGSPARMALLRRGWRQDHLPPGIDVVHDTVHMVQSALIRRAHPDFPPPDPATLFVATRSVLGAIRAAVLENSDLPDRQDFEDRLVTMTLALVAAPAAS